MYFTVLGAERLKVQADKSQNTRGDGTPPQALPPAGSHPTVLRILLTQARKPDSNSFSDCPQRVRTGITDPLPHFGPHFQLRAHGQSLPRGPRRTQPHPTTQMRPLGSAPVTASSQGHPQPRVLCTRKLFSSHLPWSPCPRRMTVTDSLAIGPLGTAASACSGPGGPHLLPPGSQK